MKLQDNEVKLAVYCRLSVDDKNSSLDSISIQNQKELLTKYAKEKEWKIINYYIDDGYSGTNFNRQAFKSMIYDIENKKINTIITKDLSRLGRDYLKVGYYIDKYFKDKDIRYISLSDNIDTQISDDDFLPFKNIINEMYAKDISKKIRFTINNQMKTGKSIKTAVPLYGYKYDQNSNRIPDSNTSSVVKLIFELFLNGNSYSSIARILKEKKILTPKYYNYETYKYGSNKIENNEECYSWNRDTIRKLLLNDEYLGIYRRGKSSIMFKSKKINHVAMNEQYIFYDKYEPLIDKITFENAQIRANMAKNYKNNNKNYYSGLVYCGKCGNVLRYKKDKRVNKDDYIRLTCRNSKCDLETTITFLDLDKKIKKELIKLKKIIVNNKEEFINEVTTKKELIIDNSILDERIIKEDINKIELYIKKAYEQNVDGILEDSIYKIMIEKYTKERDKLLEKYKLINLKINHYKINKMNLYNDCINFINEINNIKNTSKIKDINLNSIINKIYIYPDFEKKNNKKIIINYKNIDFIIKEMINKM